MTEFDLVEWVRGGSYDGNPSEIGVMLDLLEESGRLEECMEVIFQECIEATMACEDGCHMMRCPACAVWYKLRRLEKKIEGRIAQVAAMKEVCND